MLADVLTKDSVKNSELHDTVKSGSFPRPYDDGVKRQSGKFCQSTRPSENI